jgi:hypothetical protein
MRTLALDRQSGAQHVVAYRQIGQPHVQARAEQSFRDTAMPLAVVGQDRNCVHHNQTLPRTPCGSRRADVDGGAQQDGRAAGIALLIGVIITGRNTGVPPDAEPHQGLLPQLGLLHWIRDI